MKNTKINLVPLISFDGRRPFLLRLRRWWLRYSSRMRRLGGSYTTIPLLMNLRLRWCLERCMGLSVSRYIRSSGSNIRLAKMGRGDVCLQGRCWSSRRVLLLLLLRMMVKRRRMGRRRVDTEELDLIRQSPDSVLQVSNGRLVRC